MRRTAIQRMAVLLLFGILFVTPALTRAQEHPEHPEHPAEAADDTAERPLTIEELAESIMSFVTHDTATKGGYFLVYDTVAKAPLALTLDHIHQEKLTGLGDGVYFACADFNSTDEKVYDLDIFMKETDHGLVATEVHVHKVDGVARYNWKETDGVWSRVEIE